MPLELIADRPGHALLQAYEEPPLEPNQVRVRSLFSAVKHGTELSGFRADTSDASDRWDGELRLHRRGEAAGDGFLMAFQKNLAVASRPLAQNVLQRIRELLHANFVSVEVEFFFGVDDDAGLGVADVFNFDDLGRVPFQVAVVLYAGEDDEEDQ